jgi:hypothetical protein
MRMEAIAADSRGQCGRRRMALIFLLFALEPWTFGRTLLQPPGGGTRVQWVSKILVRQVARAGRFDAGKTSESFAL